MGPLNGVKVLDLSRILAGPWSTQMLADLGAEVWKIEQPIQGDDTRKWGPPYLKNTDNQPTSESAYYLSANRGKHSISVDISQPEGQKILHQLVAKADILVENFKVGGLEKYQLDYSSIQKIKPDIIYCSITGFGQTGPLAKRAGYDAMIQAMGGLMSITGNPEGTPGGGPQKVGVAVVDLMTGMYATTGILAALYHRQQTGQGQHIDLALLDTQVSWLANQGANYLIGGLVPQPQGTAHPNIVPYQSISTKDGHIMLAVGNDRQFNDCCKILGVPELATDSRFQQNRDRVANRETLIPLLEQRFQLQSLDYWLEHLSKASVPCGPINTLDRVFEEPQVISRNMVTEMHHHCGSRVPLAANPIKFSESTIEYKKAPPVLGEDTAEILIQELGMTKEQIEALRERGMIQ